MKYSSKNVLITFDDGSLSIIKNAVPILRKHKIKALLFLNMNAIENQKFFAGEASYLYFNENKFKK